MSIARLIRTLKPFRTSQLIWRLKNQVLNVYPSRDEHWKWRAVHPPKLSNDLHISTSHVPQKQNPYSILRCLQDGKLSLLNSTREIGNEKKIWNLGSVKTNRLWTISLHYHEWLASLSTIALTNPEALSTIIKVIEDWIDSCCLNAEGSRSLAWNSYAIATRIRCWITIWNQVSNVLPEKFKMTFLRSLWQQARYLRAHLEWDLRANHLLRDAVGLAWAGRFFKEPESIEWLECAAILAKEQIIEQVLPDGGHFERSPMYHAHAINDFLELDMLLGSEPLSQVLQPKINEMFEVFQWMRHPDGTIPLLNDAAENGIDSIRDRLLAQLNRTKDPFGGRFFKDTGYFVWHAPDISLFFDAGSVGPDEQPGHSHADTFTLECSIFSRKFIVDPGTHSYDNNEIRSYDRSTQSHNTVSVDNQNSSEVWHIFRLGRRARVSMIKYGFDPDVFISAQHDGYRYLSGRPVHGRRIDINKSGTVRIEDIIEGSGEHAVEGGWLISPDWKIDFENGSWRASFQNVTINIKIDGSQPLQMAMNERRYHPEYGIERLAHRISWKFRGAIPLKVVSEFQIG